MARVSQRAFSAEPLPLEALSALLGCLCSGTVEGEPKYQYGSAGSSYAV